jgi:hypothetical protein
MGKQQIVNRRVIGLFTHYNSFQVPEGALLQADNCVIDREGIVSKRRGMNRHGAALSASASSLMEFKDRLVLLEGTTLKYDSDGLGTWLPWTGAFGPPDTSTRIHFVEARSNLYFTSLLGIYKNDLLTNSPKKAGMPKGLDIQSSLTGTGSGWFGIDKQIAHRVVFAREDGNKVLIAGAPSEREILTNPANAVLIDWNGGLAIVKQTAHGYATGDRVTISNAATAAFNGIQTITVVDSNTYHYPLLTQPADITDVTAKSGKAFNVSVTFTLPADLQAGDNFELYRTDQSANAATDPGEEFFRIKKMEITAGDLATGTITLTDTFGDEFLDLPLVTNPSEETIAGANYPPPWAKDLSLYRGFIFFLNTRREHKLELQLQSLTGLLGDNTQTLRVSDGTNTLDLIISAAEDIANRKFKLSSAESTTAKNIELTVKSIIRVINRNAASRWYAEYISSADDPPGKFRLYARTIAGAPFHLNTPFSAVGSAFTPVIPIDPATTLKSDNEARKNRLYHSKFEQPEAVPLTNFDDIGSEENEALRIISLRDSLIILTIRGVYRLSGDSESSFVITQLDPTIKLLCPETAVVLDNSVYAVTDQGVTKINESGTSIVSRPIENELLKLFNFENFKNLTHAVKYESERKYLLFAQEFATDTKTKVIWCYNYLTESWTRWKKAARAALVLENSDTLFLAHADDFYILRERKSFNTSDVDYSDESIPVTVTATGTTISLDGLTVSTATVTYSYTETLAAGFLFDSANFSSRIVAVTALGGTSYLLELEEYIPSLATGAATISLPIKSRLRFAPEAVGNPTLMKQFSEVQIYFESDKTSHHRLGIFTDLIPYEAAKNFDTDPTTGWGIVPFGEGGWGDEDAGGGPIRDYIPLEMQWARALTVVYAHEWTREKFDITTMSLIYRLIGEVTTMAPR